MCRTKQNKKKTREGRKQVPPGNLAHNDIDESSVANQDGWPL